MKFALFWKILLGLSFALAMAFAPGAASAQIVALGASVVQGYGVNAGEAWPPTAVTTTGSRI
jgi:hypothetical protein